MNGQKSSNTVTIVFPRPFHGFLDGQKQIQVGASTVKEALENVTVMFPRLKKHLVGELDRWRDFLHVYVNDEDVRNLKGEERALRDNDSIRIVPSIIGGRGISNQ